MSSKPSVIYQAVNKVFCVTFWNKDEAETFVNTQGSNVSGFRVQEVQVFGDKARWINDQTSTLEKDLNHEK